jgi:hypothetical protein
MICGREERIGLNRQISRHTHTEKSLIEMVPTEGVEPTHSYEYQILSLARLPIPPRRLPKTVQNIRFFLVRAREDSIERTICCRLALAEVNPEFTQSADHAEFCINAAANHPLQV